MGNSAKYFFKLIDNQTPLVYYNFDERESSVSWCESVLRLKVGSCVLQSNAMQLDIALGYVMHNYEEIKKNMEKYKMIIDLKREGEPSLVDWIEHAIHTDTNYLVNNYF